MGSRSSLHEDFVGVKTHMGLERFEVGKHFQPISESLGICEGICFWAKKNFAVFFQASRLPISKINLIRLKANL